MYITYPAILRGKQLEWNQETPRLNKDSATSVYVTIMEEMPESDKQASQGERMAQALETLANLASHLPSPSEKSR